MMKATIASVALLLQQYATVQAYYLPGVRPQSFKEGQDVKLKVNKMTSTKTLIPIDYYRLPFCRPNDGIMRDNENLGEFLAGDKIENSPYKLLMKTDLFCEHLCLANVGRVQTSSDSGSNTVKAIRKEYHNNWIVDNLPAASKVEDDKLITTRYWQGFPIGYVGIDDNAYIHNHVNIEISYHEVEDEPGHYRVVRFTVEPFSIAHQLTMDPTTDRPVQVPEDEQEVTDSVLPKITKIANPIDSCNPDIFVGEQGQHTDYDMIVAEGQNPQLASGWVLFTYDVIWKPEPNLHWASRWDIYLSMDNAIPAKVHWLSIANSLVIVIVLTAMIAAILVRNLHRDIARYNRVATDEESRAEELEEYGWKLVHGDVFRAPSFSPMLLSVASGTGAQLLCMTLMVIVFSALGFMSPARRGHLLMTELILFVLLGAVNGYVTARLYKSFMAGQPTNNWQTATAYTAFGLPGIAFTVFLFMNFIALVKHSTDAVPFFTMFILVALWFGISTPLVYVGAYVGYQFEPISFPVKTSSIPRQIPTQPWFMGVPFTLLVGGILPFGSCFVELYYIMSSVWMDYYYYVFGFLFLVFIILVLTCAEITILFTYFQLCSEDYHWWWRSFCNAGSTAIYVFMYSFIYFKQLEANSVATYVLYFGYMGLVSLGLFTMMGFIGLISSLWFNRTIFASIKID